MKEERKKKTKQTKNSAQISHYMKLTQPNGPNLGGQKSKGRKNSTLKPGKRRPQTVSFKKIMRRERNTAQMKEQTRNTEDQINEEETGKLLKKEFRIMVIEIIKNLENKLEKMQESNNKALEDLKINIQR